MPATADEAAGDAADGDFDNIFSRLQQMRAKTPRGAHTAPGEMLASRGFARVSEASRPRGPKAPVISLSRQSSVTQAPDKTAFKDNARINLQNIASASVQELPSEALTEETGEDFDQIMSKLKEVAGKAGGLSDIRSKLTQIATSDVLASPRGESTNAHPTLDTDPNDVFARLQQMKSMSSQSTQPASQPKSPTSQPAYDVGRSSVHEPPVSPRKAVPATADEAASDAADGDFDNIFSRLQQMRAKTPRGAHTASGEMLAPRGFARVSEASRPRSPRPSAINHSCPSPRTQQTDQHATTAAETGTAAGLESRGAARVKIAVEVSTKDQESKASGLSDIRSKLTQIATSNVLASPRGENTNAHPTLDTDPNDVFARLQQMKSMSSQSTQPASQPKSPTSQPAYDVGRSSVHEPLVSPRKAVPATADEAAGDAADGDEQEEQMQPQAKRGGFGSIRDRLQRMRSDPERAEPAANEKGDALLNARMKLEKMRRESHWERVSRADSAAPVVDGGLSAEVDGLPPRTECAEHATPTVRTNSPVSEQVAARCGCGSMCGCGSVLIAVVCGCG